MSPRDLDLLLHQIQYPGMTYVESEITRAWLAKRGGEYDSIEWNVRLGAGVGLGDEYSESTRRQAEMLTQKRADIVAQTNDAVTIVEVKVRVGLPALGQLLGYRELWLRAHADGRRVRLLAIGRSVVSDVDAIMRAQGVEVETFPRAAAGGEG